MEQAEESFAALQQAFESESVGGKSTTSKVNTASRDASGEITSMFRALVKAHARAVTPPESRSTIAIAKRAQANAETAAAKERAEAVAAKVVARRRRKARAAAEAARAASSAQSARVQAAEAARQAAIKVWRKNLPSSASTRALNRKREQAIAARDAERNRRLMERLGTAPARFPPSSVVTKEPLEVYEQYLLNQRRTEAIRAKELARDSKEALKAAERRAALKAARAAAQAQV